MTAHTVRVRAPLAPADRWPLLDDASRAMAMSLAEVSLEAQAARDVDWYTVDWSTSRVVRRGFLPGYRKPWAYLEVRGAEVAA